MITGYTAETGRLVAVPEPLGEPERVVWYDLLAPTVREERAVAAATGIPVVKHGNKAASSASGSSDVLGALGIDLSLSPERVAEVLAEVGITFAFASAFHPGFRHAGPTRAELGVPTVFNFLGPLCNPARAEANAVGVADDALVQPQCSVPEAQRAGAIRPRTVFVGTDAAQCYPAAGGYALLVRETIRPDASVETLGALRPSFAQIGEMGGFDAVAVQHFPQAEKIEHRHTPGNSSGIVDGAALAVVGSGAAGEAMGMTPRAKVVATATTGADPVVMLTGPVPASRKALDAAGLSVSDIDLFEVNEAFAAVPIWYGREMGVPEDVINVNGGAIAMGHPLGATGAMLLGTVLDELERRDQRRALITLCIGAGMGIATIIERV